jgi:hypothetical protein
MPCPSPFDYLRRRRRQASRCSALVLLALLPAAAAVAAPKTDVVVFLNGDRLTGEVKGLERGQLRLKTDAAGTLSIEWARLASVTSSQLLHVELASGLRYVGQAFEGAAPGKIRVAASGEGGGREFAFADVVRMDPIEQGAAFTVATTPIWTNRPTPRGIHSRRPVQAQRTHRQHERQVLLI